MLLQEDVINAILVWAKDNNKEVNKEKSLTSNLLPVSTTSHKTSQGIR